jgi:hypothetical protein
MELSDLYDFEPKEKGVENLLMQIKHGSNTWEKEECCCTNDAKKNMELKFLYHIDEDNSDENDSIIMIYITKNPIKKIEIMKKHFVLYTNFVKHSSSSSSLSCSI